MALTTERIREIERSHVYNQTATLVDFARAIEAEVQKQDMALIRQLLNALRIDRIDTEDWPADSRIAIDALRARLEGKP